MPDPRTNDPRHARHPETLERGEVLEPGPTALDGWDVELEERESSPTAVAASVRAEFAQARGIVGGIKADRASVRGITGGVSAHKAKVSGIVGMVVSTDEAEVERGVAGMVAAAHTVEVD